MGLTCSLLVTPFRLTPSFSLGVFVLALLLSAPLCATRTDPRCGLPFRHEHSTRSARQLLAALCRTARAIPLARRAHSAPRVRPPPAFAVQRRRCPLRTAALRKRSRIASSAH